MPQRDQTHSHRPRYPDTIILLKAEQEPHEQLRKIARRVCWWQPAEETLADTPLFLCRLMALGTWDDAAFCLVHFGEDAFRSAIKSAPPGVLDPRSWHYWHHRLRLTPVPPVPVRAIPA